MFHEGCEHDPVQHQVEQRIVEGGQAEPRQEGEQHASAEDQERRALHESLARRIHAARPGRSTRMTMSSVNETIGAHDGAVTAIVIASLTPITVPAMRGARARPRPPSITAAKTTPIQAYICEGVSVEPSARQTPATLASAAQVPASSSAFSFWLTPKADAIGASSAAARIALPRSV